MLRRPNPIEKKNNMNCCTCSYQGRCRFASNMTASYRSETICTYYTNPEKGCFEDPKKERKVRKDGGNEDDYEIIKMPIIQEEKK